MTPTELNFTPAAFCFRQPMHQVAWLFSICRSQCSLDTCVEYFQQRKINRMLCLVKEVIFQIQWSMFEMQSYQIIVPQDLFYSYCFRENKIKWRLCGWLSIVLPLFILEKRTREWRWWKSGSWNGLVIQMFLYYLHFPSSKERQQNLCIEWIL